MAIPKNINKEHVIEAIKRIDEKEYQKEGVQQGSVFLMRGNIIHLNM